jgi:hypothetical protein
MTTIALPHDASTSLIATDRPGGIGHISQHPRAA